jgi:hypothetical protein
MVGKTISAYTDQETSERIEAISKRESRKRAQIAGMAVKFFVNLSDEARTAWFQIEALASPQELEQIQQQIARTLLDAHYTMVHQQVLHEIKVDNLGSLETEDDILAAAVSLSEL